MVVCVSIHSAFITTCIAVTLAERLHSNGTVSSLSSQEPADVGLDGVAAVDEDSSDTEERMTRSKRRKRTRVSR